MPTPRRLKTGIRGRPKKKPSSSYPLHKVGDVFHIKARTFEKVRDSPDLVALTRVSRIHNVLTDSFAKMLDYDGKSDKRSPRNDRAIHRTILTTAGYVLEAYKVIESLHPSYHNDPFYSKFLELYTDSERDGNKKILKAIRNSVAFHLDQDNRHTKDALMNLVVKHTVEFVSGNDLPISERYYHLADIIDRAYLIDTLRQPGEPDDEVLDRLNTLVFKLVGDVLFGCEELIDGTSMRLGFSQPPNT